MVERNTEKAVDWKSQGRKKLESSLNHFAKADIALGVGILAEGVHLFLIKSNPSFSPGVVKGIVQAIPGVGFLGETIRQLVLSYRDLNEATKIRKENSGNK